MPRHGQAAGSSAPASTWRRGSERARERFLAAYAVTLKRTGAPIAVDLDLLDAFEVAKEAYEFEYAATVLPTWLWAPRDGMRWLLGRGGSA